MRLLILEWDSFGHEYILDAFRKSGCEVDCFPWPFGTEPMRENSSLENSLSEYMGDKNYHFVFSFNFFPVAAKVCHRHGTKYISWIYDSPYMLLYSKYADCPTSQIYIFDRSVCQQCWDRGMANVYYLPMAAPVDYYDKLLDKRKDKSRYEGDISFVGSTYKESRNDFYFLLKQMDSYTSGYLDALIHTQKELSGIFILEEFLPKDIIEKLKKVCPIEKAEDEWESDAWIYANYFLARRVTGMQRTEALQLLSEGHEVKLYTTENTSELRKVKNCGSVDYLSEMPSVFRDSKINLNITLKSIHSGIPLRAMEIMGSRGFLLTDYQADFLDFFEPGKDFVYYTDMEDLLQKVSYYLAHEDERDEIANNGYQKVVQHHTYRHRVELMLANVMDEAEAALNDSINALEEIRRQQGGCWYQMKIDWTNMDGQELKEATDKQMAWMEAEKRLSFQCRDRLLELVDKALAEKTEEAYERLSLYFSKNIISTFFVPFSEILYTYAFVQLYRLEKEKGMPYTIRKYENHQQLSEVYRQLTFYFRRIDCDLEHEYQMELLRYIEQEQLSPVALCLILSLNDCLDSNRIMKKLQSLTAVE